MFITTLPIYLVMGLGFACVNTGYIASDSVRAISGFKVKIGLPALIFGSVVSPRCLIPGFDGAIPSLEWKEALWDKFANIEGARECRLYDKTSVQRARFDLIVTFFSHDLCVNRRQRSAEPRPF
ncbi:AEC family transporter [Albidovulum aquaemixtae]|uniref:AEC family transporter n=1 Tax=Albidovulum aquaemixtae TaxID=1542388 RepID=UPI0034D9709D